MKVRAVSVVLAVFFAASCKKDKPAESTATVVGFAQEGGAAALQTHAPPVAVAAADSGFPAATGSTATIEGEHCTLRVAFTPPAPGPTGSGSISVTLEAKDGYHVNELDQVNLHMEGTNVLVRAELEREGAAHSDANSVRFDVPANVLAPEPVIEGRLRFSVCERVCIRQRLSFAVNTHGAPAAAAPTAAAAPVAH